MLQHLLGLLVAALGAGLLSAVLAKWIWHRAFKATGLLQLAGWTSGAGVVALAVGLVAFGHDGKLVSYAALVVLNALCLAWVGWGRGRR